METGVTPKVSKGKTGRCFRFTHLSGRCLMCRTLKIGTLKVIYQMEKFRHNRDDLILTIMTCSDPSTSECVHVTNLLATCDVNESNDNKLQGET